MAKNEGSGASSPLDHTVDWWRVDDPDAEAALASLPPRRRELDLPGLPGRYAVQRVLGAGGMGMVYLANDRLLEVTTALKVLASDLLRDGASLGRFTNEARVTAQLRHPGIVAVLDRGELDDGRPWYTMTLVQGRTFTAIVDEAWQDGPPDPAQQRHLLDLLRRACQAMAYAHVNGVVHRDLKPDNLMVGAFGQVLVMDWGLARRLDGSAAESTASGELPPVTLEAGRTAHGAVVGTPAWMAPEQARGELDQIGPPADVYALGAVLHRLLTGRDLYVGSAIAILRQVLAGPPVLDLPGVDPELADICERALEWEIEDRLADAGELAEELGAWLDGARRKARAQQILAEAEAMLPAIDAQRAEARALRQQARALLSPLPAHAGPQKKAPAWQLEDAATALEVQTAIAEVQWRQTVGAALQQVPRLPEAHAALAEHYAHQLLDAEGLGRAAEVARFETLLARHDRGQHAALLEGSGTLTLLTEPAGAEARLFAYVDDARRLVPEARGSLGLTPLREVSLPRGSWLVELHHPDCEVVRYPVHIGRGESWTGVPPEGGAAQPVVLPARGSLADDDCYVPAGWFWSGGDPEALEPLPRRRLWADALVAKRHPVTHGEYIEFLDALVASGQADTARRHVPRADARHGAQHDEQPLYLQAADGSWALGPDLFDRPLSLRHPVVMVDRSDVAAYIAWRAQRDGQAWRLPNELEWEKLGRGVDGRTTVWGAHFEPARANVIGSTADRSRLASVDGHPDDNSVYGVRGLMGNATDRCSNPWSDDGPVLPGDRVAPPEVRSEGDPSAPPMFTNRGGSYMSQTSFCRLATRLADGPQHRWWMLGFRLVRDL